VLVEILFPGSWNRAKQSDHLGHSPNSRWLWCTQDRLYFFLSGGQHLPARDSAESVARNKGRVTFTFSSHLFLRLSSTAKVKSACGCPSANWHHRILAQKAASPWRTKTENPPFRRWSYISLVVVRTASQSENATHWLAMSRAPSRKAPAVVYWLVLAVSR
jgi:hypothetical protein